MSTQPIGKRGARFNKKTPGQVLRNAVQEAGSVQGTDTSRVRGGRAPAPESAPVAQRPPRGQQPEEVVVAPEVQRPPRGQQPEEVVVEGQRPIGGRRPIYVAPPTVIVAPAAGSTGPETYEWMGGLLLFFTLIVIFFIGLSLGSRE